MSEPPDRDQKGPVEAFQASDADRLVRDARRGGDAHDEDRPPAPGERRGGHLSLRAGAAEVEAPPVGAGLGGPSSRAPVARGDLALAREEPGSGEPQVQQAGDGVGDAVRGDLEEAVVGALAQAKPLFRSQKSLLVLRGDLLEGLAELAVLPVATRLVEVLGWRESGRREKKVVSGGRERKRKKQSRSSSESKKKGKKQLTR